MVDIREDQGSQTMAETVTDLEEAWDALLAVLPLPPRA
jgi:hypothetical protein